jgi:hypothetical protein
VSQSLLITVSGSGSGKITGPGIDCPPDCSESFLPAVRVPGRLPPMAVTLTATPTPGTQSQFQRWGESCAAASGPTCTLHLTPNPSGNPTWITAVFVGPPPTPPRLNVSVQGSGRVTGAGINCPGDCSEARFGLPDITAAPALGWRFKGWSGSCSGTAATCPVSSLPSSPGQSFAVSAYFEVLPPSQLHVAIEGAGKVTGTGISCPSDCDEQIPAPVVLTPVVEPGQRFIGWGAPCSQGKLSSRNPNPSCTVANTGAPITVSAQFGP